MIFQHWRTVFFHNLKIIIFRTRTKKWLTFGQDNGKIFNGKTKSEYFIVIIMSLQLVNMIKDVILKGFKIRKKLLKKKFWIYFKN
jgi:hypothetical protein